MARISALSITAAKRQLAQEGYRRLPHSAGATGDYTYHVYRNRRANSLVDLAVYEDGSADIIHWRSRLNS